MSYIQPSTHASPQPHTINTHIPNTLKEAKFKKETLNENIIVLPHIYIQKKNYCVKLRNINKTKR